jgi:hypothetical protein
LSRKFKFKYSTVDDYFKALKVEQERNNLQWPQFTGDFFPYNGVYSGSYWSGYYSSRPGFKKLIRDYTGTSQALENLISMQVLKNRTNARSVNDFKRVKGFSRGIINSVLQKVGELTHHDTITGTSLKQVIVTESDMIYRNLTRVMTLS